jgi:5'-3' exonuclease
MKLLLIDGNSLINRAFYAIRTPLSNKNGVYTHAILGFFNSFLRLRGNLEPDRVAVAFDLRAPTFRHEMFDGYKKRRKGMPEELAVQMPYIKQILDLMGIARVELEGFEADDIIGTLANVAKSSNAECYIATGDRDSFQLIADNVSVVLASTKEELICTPAVIADKYGISPEQFIEIKALMGDSSDDIPGVAGIGEKTAFALIEKFGNVDYIYDNLPTIDVSAGVRAKLEKDREMCFLSRDLARIAVDAPVETNLESYRISDADSAGLARLLTELELASLLKKLGLEAVEGISDVSGTAVADSARILEIEQSLDAVLRDMEAVGVKVDAEGLRRFGEELTPQIASLQSAIHTLAGEEFLISSPKQLGEILFSETKLGLPHGKKTKTGYSTNSEVLEFLADKHEIVPLILEYRALTKLSSTYVEGLLKCVGEDSRVRTTYKSETRTGRISSVEPNIQNIPVRTERGRVMRRFFVADSGKLLIDADYSQIELRVLAAISRDSAMLEAFASGADIHSQTALQVFGAADAKRRSAAKAVNFGIVYGMGAFSLAKEIGVSVAEAKDYIERYLEKYSGVREYLERTVEDAKASGYVATMLGRVRQVPEIQSSNHNLRQSGERIAKNTPIQGTAADIIKIAMIRVHSRLQDTDARLTLQVHDELIAEAPEDFASQTAAILEEEMLAAGREVGMELAVDVRTGRSWYETH